MSLFNSDKILNYWSGDYVTSLTDLMAVKYGIKKTNRIECNSLEEYKKIKSDFSKHGLHTAISDYELFGKYNVYISKNIKYALEAKNVDPSYKIIKEEKTFHEVIDSVVKFSKLISYPTCCTKEYLYNTENKIDIAKAKIFSKIPNKINFVYNNILSGVSNHFFSFHLPCSFKCKKTFDYQKKIFQVIKKNNLTFAVNLKQHLQHPFLLFFDPSLGNVYVSWDNRQGIIFDGKMVNNKINYNKYQFFKTNYPDYENNKRETNMSLILRSVGLGNNIIFEKNGFTILKNKKKIYRFNNEENMIACLFNFV